MDELKLHIQKKKFIVTVRETKGIFDANFDGSRWGRF